MGSKQYVKPNGQGALHAAQAAEQLRALTSVLEDRLIMARMLGMTHQGKRNTYEVFGYDDTVTWRQYRERYDRGGIARRVVNALPDAVWRGEGELFEDEDPEKETQFEKEWVELNEQHDVWSTLKRTHILASLGSFSGLLLGQNGDLSAPLPKGRPGGLLYLTPYGGGIVNASVQRGVGQGLDADLTIASWDENSSSRRFGQPLTYQLKRTYSNNPGRERAIHWSRIIHVPSRGFLEDAVFGPPELEDVWNYLLDLDKVVGGGAEAFWMRANAGTQFNFDKKMGTPGGGPLPSAAELAAMQEQADLYVHQMSRVLRTRGVEINQLGSDVADFRNPMDAIVTLIAGTKGIPKRILMGSEAGSLASDQDRDNWNDQVKDCRASYAHPTLLRPFVNRLIEYDYLSKPTEWHPMWPDEEAMSEPEKIVAAEGLMKLNDHGTIVMTSAEAREYLGYEPLDDAQIEEELKVREATTVADKDPSEDPEANPNADLEDEDADPEEEQIEQLAAALKKGSTVTIEVKG